MAFSTKRGRPKAIDGRKNEIDLGTAQLQEKRKRNLTKEPIDICKEKGLIDDAQFASALHFRWLYTLKFGAAGVSAMNLEDLKGREIRMVDEDWQIGREKEYAHAVENLRHVGALKIVMNITVFNNRPKFLRSGVNYEPSQMRQYELELAKLREGLGVLANMWERR